MQAALWCVAICAGFPRLSYAPYLDHVISRAHEAGNKRHKGPRKKFRFFEISC